MDNTYSDISWLVKASKYVDPDLQITIGLRQALFLTLLPDTFTTQHALLIGCLLHISPRMVNHYLNYLIDAHFLNRLARSLYAKTQ